MIIDITGVILIPGNLGKDCPGNGVHKETECCCDECDYYLYCFPQYDWRLKRNRFKKWLKDWGNEHFSRRGKSR